MPLRPNGGDVSVEQRAQCDAGARLPHFRALRHAVERAVILAEHIHYRSHGSAAHGASVGCARRQRNDRACVACRALSAWKTHDRARPETASLQHQSRAPPRRLPAPSAPCTARGRLGVRVRLRRCCAPVLALQTRGTARSPRPAHHRDLAAGLRCSFSTSSSDAAPTPSAGDGAGPQVLHFRVETPGFRNAAPRSVYDADVARVQVHGLLAELDRGSA